MSPAVTAAAVAVAAERGDVIRDGDTIEGIEPGEKWRCLQEEALIPPDRLVIDLDPGDDLAAGERYR